MGEALLVLGIVGGLGSLLALLRGRLWLIRSRKQALATLAASFVLFVVSGAFLPAPQDADTQQPASQNEAQAQAEPEQELVEQSPSTDTQTGSADQSGPVTSPSPETKDASPPSLGVSRQDIQARLAPAGFTFQKRADLYGQPHMQGTADTGASVSLIGPPDGLTRIEITLTAGANDEVNTEYVASVFQAVLQDDAGDAMKWVGQQLSHVESKSLTSKKTFGAVTVDVGADPSGYVSIALYPAEG